MKEIFGCCENIYVHPSQFPDKVHQEFLACFTSGKINHKFHYDSVKQSQKWLDIHQSYSPLQTNPSCIQAYQACFQKTAKFMGNDSGIQVISLGCGGGAKDSLLIDNLLQDAREMVYYPIDVSLSLALISGQKIKKTYPQVSVTPIVCDITCANDLIPQNHEEKKEFQKIITFFGMIQNFSPEEILPILSGFLQPGDILLMSATLSPGNDYLSGIQSVLPLYDNELTKDWLMSILVDAGVNPNQGRIKFSIKDDLNHPHLKKINAQFETNTNINLKLSGQSIHWKRGEHVQLFFSYRYTTSKLQKILEQYDIVILDYWEDTNHEEGIYFCQKRFHSKRK